MKQRLKGLLALTLSLVLMLSMVTVGWGAVNAQGVHVCDTADCLVCDVAAKINALPAASDITVNNAATITEQIHAIDRVKVDLTDTQYDELLTVVTTRPNSSGYGLAEPVLYMEAVEALTNFTGGGSLYPAKKYSVGTAELDWAQTDATLTIECLDAGSSFAPLSVTLADIEESSLAGFYSSNADGWTNRYILPAGTYKITETGYNAVTTDGAVLTTTPSYEVNGQTSTDYAIVTVEEGGSHAVSVYNNYAFYEVWIGNTQVYSLNVDDVLGDGTVSYDPANNILTLNGIDLTYDSGHAISASGDLTIVLEEGTTNTVTSENSNGINVTGKLTILGKGELTATGINYGIYGNTGVSIEEGKVVAYADDSIGTGIGTNYSSGSSGGSDVILISGEGTEVEVGCETGLSSTTVTIKDNCKLTINSSTTAISCNTLNLNDDVNNGGSLWYQWTTTEGGEMRMSREEAYTYDSSHHYLKIEKAPPAYTVTFMNGDDVWEGPIHITAGNWLGIAAMHVPNAPADYPAGSVFFRWYTQENVWVHHGMIVDRDIVAYATWRLPIKGTVTISGRPVVGETLTANADITTDIPYLNYQWLLIEGENKMAIRGADSDTYTPTAADVGKLLACAVSCPEAVPGSIIAEVGVVRSSGDGAFFPVYIPTVETKPAETITSPDTFDGGIALYAAVTILSATGGAWLAKKKD